MPPCLGEKRSRGRTKRWNNDLRIDLDQRTDKSVDRRHFLTRPGDRAWGGGRFPSRSGVTALACFQVPPPQSTRRKVASGRR